MIKTSIKLKKRINLSNSSLSIFLSLVSKQLNKIAYFGINDESITKLKNHIKLVDPNLEVLLFPSFDCTFFSNVSPTTDLLHERINTLYNLIFTNNKRTILLGSMNALVTQTIPKTKFKDKFVVIKSDSKNFYGILKNFLKENNYNFVDVVRNKGECCIRGQIIDLYSPVEDLPIRILYNLDDVESLNHFNQSTQNNCGLVEKYVISPTSEIIFDSNSIKFFRESFRKCKIENKDEFYKSISNGLIIPGSEQFYPILYNDYDSLLNYLGEYYFFFWEELINNYQNNYHDLTQEIKQSNANILNESNFFQDEKKLNKLLQNSKIHYLTNSNYHSDTLVFSEQKGLKNKKSDNIKNLKKLVKSNEFKKFFFCFNSNISKKKITKICDEYDIDFDIQSSIYDQSNSNKKFSLVNISIDKSFILNLEANRSLFLSEHDFFDKIIKKITDKGTRNDSIINEFNQLSLGDLIVHIDHGVGRFNGLKKKIISEIEQEFIELIYFNNDKLLIPIENLELISRYGFSEKKIQLDRLGLQNWQLKKATLKKKIKEIASELINTAAKRELIKSIKLNPNYLEYEKFSSFFEFTETSDQVKVINQIEEDLRSNKAMDRLICGDVGFGKTEIAMRTAFLILSSGFQVAIVCPKVLLVNQHFNTFSKRFTHFNYTIEKISRFEKTSKKEEIKEKIKLGLIDLIIGTHAILSDDINFKNLGLIVIDEEQSFGVEQKEKLKKIKPNAHILTMTATPIPRTLQASLLNLRDISFIKTPPINRLNVKTYLMFYEDKLLKKIINQELERDGQIFFVTPRIQEIKDLEKKLKKNSPNLNYSVIHSKLKTSEIEEVYNNFFNKKIDLLLSTAMIESGLDISNVNTIIINKPYLFGLSQLYQLRGRVGRSSIQAYAYLILEKNTMLDDKKLHRLQLISKIDKLGAGFSIAANDLDIRGSGNIVGAEQSGHIKEVGIELYHKMLNEAVSELKNEKTSNTDWSPLINLGFSFSIPDNYIKNFDLRMHIYRKISEISEISELKSIIRNLEDRFGNFPNLFKNLFKIIEIKILCKKLNIKSINKSTNGFVLELKDSEIEYIDKIIDLAKKNPDKIKLLPKSKLMYINKTYDNFKKVMSLKVFLESLIENVE